MTLDTDYKLFKFVFLVSLCSHMILVGTSFTNTIIILIFRILGSVIISVITALAVVLFTRHFIQKLKGGKINE